VTIALFDLVTFLILIILTYLISKNNFQSNCKVVIFYLIPVDI